MAAPSPPSGHLFASVPEAPARQLKRLFGRPVDVEEAQALARERDDPRLLAEVAGAVSDHLVEQGKLMQARAALLEGQIAADASGLSDQALSLDRRDAWIGYQLGEPGSIARIEHLREQCEAAGLEVDAAATAAYLALLCARRGEADEVERRVQALMATLRARRDRALPRLALLCAQAWAAVERPDEAQIEALRVRTWARAHGDDRLLEAASEILRDLQGEAASVHVDRLVRLAIEVGRQRSLYDVLDSVATSTLELLDADRAFVLQATAKGAEVVAATAKTGDPGQPSMSIVRQALIEGREVVAADLGGERELSAARSVVSLGLRTALCVPMVDGSRVVGALYGDSTHATHAELGRVAWLMRAFAAHAVAAIRSAEQHESSARAVQHARETSHDVRNVLHTLNMGLELLKEEVPLEPWSAELIADLVQGAKLIERQVASLVAGRREELEETDLAPLVRRVCELLKLDAQMNEVALDVQVESASVVARPDEFSRLVANLVGNAIKYAPPRSRVRITLVPDETDEHAVLTVRDHGPGIAAGELESIFTSGVQASGHREGYGLGLGIAHRLVREAGGTLTAANAPGGGAVFEMRWPLR